MGKIINYYKNLGRSEWRLFRSQVSIPEYIIWWIMRLLLLGSLISWSVSNAKGETNYHPLQILQIMPNLLGCFGIAICRFVFPKKLFLGRISYSTQKWISLLCFCFCFFGHILSLNTKPGLYFAFIEHLLSGFLLVPIGWHLAVAIKNDGKPLAPKIASMCGFGISCFCAVIWEMFEFSVDYFAVGSENQGYLFVPSQDYILYKVLGRMSANPGQLPLFDTMIDLSLGVISAILGGIVFGLVLAYKQKKTALKTAAGRTEEKEPSLCTE